MTFKLRSDRRLGSGQVKRKSIPCNQDSICQGPRTGMCWKTKRLRDPCMENILEGGRNGCKDERCDFEILLQQWWWAYPESCSLSRGPALWPVACTVKVVSQDKWYHQWPAHKKNLPGLCILWSHNLVTSLTRAMINSTTESNYLPFVSNFSGHLIMSKWPLKDEDLLFIW